MEKTTVYLTPQQKAALAGAARDQGRSEARLIRDGIERIVSAHRAGESPASIASETPYDAPPGDGRPARPRWISRDVFVQQIVSAQADPALGSDLRDLAPDLTDDSPDR